MRSKTVGNVPAEEVAHALADGKTNARGGGGDLQAHLAADLQGALRDPADGPRARDRGARRPVPAQARGRLRHAQGHTGAEVLSMPTSTAVLNRELALAFADVLSYPHGPIDADVARVRGARARRERGGGGRCSAASAPSPRRHRSGSCRRRTRSPSTSTRSRSPSPPATRTSATTCSRRTTSAARFIVGLLERYREHGFDGAAGDLPDHLVDRAALRRHLRRRRPRRGDRRRGASSRRSPGCSGRWAAPSR